MSDKRKVGRGKPVEEVKGSVEYAMNLIRSAFARLFDYGGSQVAEGVGYHIVETFADHLIVRDYNDPDLKPDEYYLVIYSQEGDAYSFAAREDWEIVELTYQPQTTAQPERLEREKPKKRGGKRLVEQVDDCGSVRLSEAQQGKPRTIHAVGITADVVNGNGRRYSSEVLQAAVDEARANISRSSLNAGRFIPLLGEAEHPSDKASGRPNVLETVVRWTDIDFDGAHVLLDGVILETAKGRDILAIMEGGVLPGISQRGYGDLRSVEENGQKIDEVTELTITGYDLVLEPSDPEAAVLVLENKSKSQEENPMNIEELKKLISDNPELLRGLVAEDIEKMGAAQLKKLEATIRESLGIGPDADLPKALAEAAAAKRTLAEQTQAAAVEAAITEHTQGLPYGDLNASFIEAVREAKPGSAEAVKSLVESKRKEYDAIVAKGRLAGMGRVQPVGPVIERETDHPAYARGAYEFTEALVRRNVIEARDLRQPKSPNERLAVAMLERFDKVYAQPLLRESRMLDEAESTSDLNLPYSASRAILAAAWPLAVAPSVFDFGVTDQAPTRVYYETYAHETGVETTVTNEAVTADLNDYVDLDYKRVKIGTVVVTNSGGTVTYTEGTDYVIDYGNGRFMAIATITNGQSLLIDYVYLAMRLGENAAIERGKMTLGYSTLEIVADRLATEITNEAVVFSRSQMGWDATTRTLNALINEIRRKIDQDAFYLALASVLSVASNSGGTWVSATGTLDDLVKYIGVARVKVAKRYYQPTAIVMSSTISDLVANWAGFTAAGSRADAALEATGYVGRLKGLPCFESTEFSDSYIMAVNRELVMARVFQPMSLKGPFPSYSSNKLLANDQWYAEEYNGSISPIANKGSYVKIT